MDKMTFKAFTAVGGRNLSEQEKFDVKLPKEILSKNSTIDYFTYKKNIYKIYNIYYHTDEDKYYLKVSKYSADPNNNLIYMQLFEEK